MGAIKMRLQKNATPHNMEISNIIKRLESGHAISPAVMCGMSAADWQEQQLFMVDIDNNISDIPILEPEDALSVCEQHNLQPAFYYPTYNDTIDKPKYRIAFIMDELITNPDVRESVVRTLVTLFPQSDKGCVNADRFFLGTNKPAVICDLSARIGVETVFMISIPPSPEKHRSAPNSHARMRANPELDALIRGFDFLSYLAERNGEYRESNGIVYFENCEICGHKDDLRYYSDTNTFYCFSADGGVGGSIIQYLMITEGLTMKEAINKLKYDLSDPEWHTPTSLGEYDCPSFPVEQFPQFLKEWVAAVAENTATPVDMAAVAALAVVASTVQGKFEIEGKADYFEPLNIYVLIIADPGERKSAVVKVMTKAIFQFEREENQRRRPDIERQQTEISIKEKQRGTAIKNGDTVSATDLKSEISGIEANMPKYLHLIADNITPEALTSLMADNGGVLSIISTEGGLFEIFAGLYNNKGVNIDTFLKAHSGDPIRVDRKGREHEEVLKPALTVLLSAQEDVLDEILSNPSFRGRGLTARILYSKPVSQMGSRDFDTPIMPPELSVKYKRLIYSLLKIPAQANQLPYLLQLDGDARIVFGKHFKWVEPQLVDDLSEMKDWGGKFVGATLRIAGILHCVRHYKAPHGHLVSADTMNRAIIIGKYFLEHAKYIFSLMGADKTVQDAKYILQRLEGQNKSSLKISEIQSLCKHFKKQTEMQPALDLLMEYGYVKMKAGKRNTGGRPEGVYYELNPRYFGERFSKAEE